MYIEPQRATITSEYSATNFNAGTKVFTKTSPTGSKATIIFFVFFKNIKEYSATSLNPFTNSGLNVKSSLLNITS